MGTKKIGWIFCALGIGCLVSCNTPQRISKAEQKDFVSFQEANKMKKKSAKLLPVIIQDGVKNGKLVISKDWVTEDHIKNIDIDHVKMVSRSNVVSERNGKVNIDFIVRVPRPLAEQDWEITITPTVEKDGNEKNKIKPVKVRGHVHNNFYFRKDKAYMNRFERAVLTNQRLKTRKDYFVTDNEKEQNVDIAIDNLRKWEDGKRLELQNIKIDTVNGKRTWEYLYTQSVDIDADDKVLKIYFDAKLQNMGEELYTLNAPDTLLYYITSLAEFCDNEDRYNNFVEEEDSIYTKQLTTQIVFKQGKATIDKKNPSNTENLKKLKEEFEELGKDNSMSLQQIKLTAACSPEGKRTFNDKLGELRAKSVKKWLILNHVTPSNGIVVNSVSENWEKLLLVIKDMNIANKKDILSLAKKDIDWDERERNIRQLFPRQYLELSKKVYPLLREVKLDCQFKVVGQKSKKRIRILDKEYLSARELMKQRKYKEALPILAKYNNFNTAVCHLCLGNNREALRILQYCEENSDTMYMLAIVYERLGMYEQAMMCLLRSYDMDASKKTREGQDEEIENLIMKYNIK